MESAFACVRDGNKNSPANDAPSPKAPPARKLSAKFESGSAPDFSIALTEMTFADGSSFATISPRGSQPAAGPELFEAKLGPDLTVVEPLRQ